MSEPQTTETDPISVAPQPSSQFKVGPVEISVTVVLSSTDPGLPPDPPTGKAGLQPKKR